MPFCEKSQNTPTLHQMTYAWLASSIPIHPLLRINHIWFDLRKHLTHGCLCHHLYVILSCRINVPLASIMRHSDIYITHSAAILLQWWSVDHVWWFVMNSAHRHFCLSYFAGSQIERMSNEAPFCHKLPWALISHWGLSSSNSNYEVVSLICLDH